MPISLVNAEEVFITSSHEMDNVVFDGKWTSTEEWKRSSEDIIFSAPNTSYLRSAHQGDSLFFMIDLLKDKSFDRGLDKAMICLDTKNNDSMTPDEDDYCFISTLGNNNGLILKGGNDFKSINHLSYIVTKFQTASNLSDKNDRYSLEPHIAYEFKISTEIIGRNNEYGLFIAVYDYQKNQYHTWPKVEMERLTDIPSPSKWGSLISPDKSLPEFEIPILLSILSIISILCITSFLKTKQKRLMLEK